MNDTTLSSYLFLFALGILAGGIGYWLYHFIAFGGFKELAAQIIKRGEEEALKIQQHAEKAVQQQTLDFHQETERFWQQEKKRAAREEERLKEREGRLEQKLSSAEKKLSDLEKREAVVFMRTEELQEEKKRLIASQQTLTQEFEKSAGLSKTEAKELLFEKISTEIKNETAHLVRRLRKEAEEEAEKEAKKLIATALNRLAVPCTSEITSCTISLPSEEMKGRIIGREGRNIRALEQATGINILIDDTPGVIVLSGFDPIRRQVAKATLQDLMQTGRIHPTSIEEAVKKAVVTVQKQIKQYGEDAALRAGALNLHPEIIQLLGKLKFRYSYGQNVLDHSLEVAHIMGLMAAEMHLDVRLAKRIGLLHDMGKAVTHEIEGSHALIGHDLALKWGERKEVANGIGCHHRELKPLTVEADLCEGADAISASREGARSEVVEEYIKRLRQLEEIAASFKSVEKAYVMQAGREIRILVHPEQVSDAEMTHLARDLTKRIEEETHYSGKIRLTLVRETRVIQYV